MTFLIFTHNARKLEYRIELAILMITKFPVYIVVIILSHLVVTIIFIVLHAEIVEILWKGITCKITVHYQCLDSLVPRHLTFYSLHQWGSDGENAYEYIPSCIGHSLVKISDNDRKQFSGPSGNKLPLSRLCGAWLLFKCHVWRSTLMVLSLINSSLAVSTS